MMQCKIVDFFYFIFPLKRWRDFLIRIHIQKCSLCQTRLAGVEDVKSVLIQENEVGNLEGLWPSVRRKLNKEEREERRIYKPRWRWAFAVAVFLVVVISGIWFYHIFTPKKSPSGEELVERFQINYIRIEEKPASAFLFQPKDSDMIFVWTEKNS